jgi:hypothetical protein
MSNRASRDLQSRARHGAGLLVVLLGLLFAVAMPTLALAASTPDTTGGTPIAASEDATPAPAATSEPGEPGSGGTGSAWERTSSSPAESAAPLLLGAVVLVILVVFIAISFGEPAEGRTKAH